MAIVSVWVFAIRDWIFTVVLPFTATFYNQKHNILSETNWFSYQILFKLLMPVPNLVSIKLNMSDFTHLQRMISRSFPVFFPHQWLNANLHEILLAQNQQSNGKSCIREKIMMETYGRSLFSSPLDLTVHLCSLPLHVPDERTPFYTVYTSHTQYMSRFNHLLK